MNEADTTGAVTPSPVSTPLTITIEAYRSNTIHLYAINIHHILFAKRRCTNRNSGLAHTVGFVPSHKECRVVRIPRNARRTMVMGWCQKSNRDADQRDGISQHCTCTVQ
ncbi:hypothetical protein HNY73_008158 [Argiope bruennichi]|uniref:Uncharacterized protein n=1 Tax=Argiope bruennichi TaxID=94029 RepID=A0A8T0FBY1_ARGBR|nr:hypothetical protein HNY73_008158 [Argiope bruennichi]